MFRRRTEQLERRGLSSLDMDKFDASVKYYFDDPEFLLKESEAATERMRSCMKAHGLGKFVK